MVVRETEGPTKSRRTVQVMTRASWQTLRQLIFNWKIQDRYNELNNCKIEVRNIFLMNSYSIKENKKYK